MSLNLKQYFIVMDFLFQKYEIEYEDNMSPQRVIEKVQEYLTNDEKSRDLISTENEENHQKLQLYRSTFPDYYGAIPVTDRIQIEEIDFTRYQYYLFRPMINVYLTIYIVEKANISTNNSILKFDIIFPTNKKIMLLKKYLQNTLFQYFIENDNYNLAECFKENFSLQILPNLNELKNNDYIEPDLNDKEIFLIIDDHSNFPVLYSLPRFYYFIENNSELDSLDFDDDEGFTIKDAKKKLIEKHSSTKNITDDQVIISFNGIIQTEKFERLDDLFCDNDFYAFKIFINQTDEEKENQNDDRHYNVPIPNKGRPLIVKIG